MNCDWENNGIPQTGLTLVYASIQSTLSVPALGVFLVSHLVWRAACMYSFPSSRSALLRVRAIIALGLFVRKREIFFSGCSLPHL